MGGSGGQASSLVLWSKVLGPKRPTNMLLFVYGCLIHQLKRVKEECLLLPMLVMSPSSLLNFYDLPVPCPLCITYIVLLQVLESECKPIIWGWVGESIMNLKFLQKPSVHFKPFKYCTLLYLHLFVHFPNSSKSNQTNALEKRAKIIIWFYILQFEPFLSVHPTHPNLLSYSKIEALLGHLLFKVPND